MKCYVIIVFSSFLFASWPSRTSAKVEVSILNINILSNTYHTNSLNSIAANTSDYSPIYAVGCVYNMPITESGNLRNGMDDMSIIGATFPAQNIQRV